MKYVIDFLKLPPRLLGALAVASGLLLFLPDTIIEKLYMTNFRNKYGFAIGIVFIVSVSILAAFVIIIGAKKIGEKYNNKRLKKDQIDYLKRIDGKKAWLISYLLNEPSNTVMLPMNDGFVVELEQCNVISPAGSTHLVNMLAPEINYFLSPWVVERIDNDPELRVKYGR